MCIFNLRVKIRSEGMWIMVLFKRPGGWYFFSKYKTACVYVILSLIAFMLLNSINSFHQYMSSLFLPPTYMLSCSLFPIFASLTLSLSVLSSIWPLLSIQKRMLISFYVSIVSIEKNIIWFWFIIWPRGAIFLCASLTLSIYPSFPVDTFTSSYTFCIN